MRTPYGQARYAAAAATGGGLHTPFGFTGQREDTTPAGSGSGLDDFNARMYDPVVGRFTSADTAQPGLGDPSGMDGYANVDGMVETATDPSGNVVCNEGSLCADGGAEGAEAEAGEGLGPIDTSPGGPDGPPLAGPAAAPPVAGLGIAAAAGSVLGIAVSAVLNAEQQGTFNVAISRDVGLVANAAAAVPMAPGDVLDTGLARRYGFHASSDGGSSGGDGGGQTPPAVTESTVSATETDPPQPATDGAVDGGGGCCECGCLPPPRGADWWRDNPGVAFGGDNLSMLGSFSPEHFVQGDGARILIPWEIAQALNGQSFSDFGAFRIAFWQAMAANPAMAGLFSPANRSAMANGNAPHAPAALSYASRGFYEINHIKPIEEGGSVYDLSNMEILAPRIHVMYHQWLDGTYVC